MKNVYSETEITQICLASFHPESDPTFNLYIFSLKGIQFLIGQGARSGDGKIRWAWDNLWLEMVIYSDILEIVQWQRSNRREMFTQQRVQTAER